ncbi:protein obstructor-E-like [Nilaparvata lugens]|uniref:protein obstructor-E-like n=1 Tax=Nilaparvata lugens TaxID=108931 RepID=UPI00193CAF37|nr:protein obstructor-E-like [Nilaparvata lugens]
MIDVSVEADSSPGCEFKFGIYADSDSCSTSYIKCEHGYPYQTPCEPGLAYDEKSHKCNWPDELQHICNPEGKCRDGLKSPVARKPVEFQP